MGGLFFHAYLHQRDVLWMVVFDYRGVGGPVVGDEEGPAASVAVVLVTLVQHIAVEEEGIPWVQFNLDQRENLTCV